MHSLQNIQASLILFCSFVYIFARNNTELAQLVEQLIRPMINKEGWGVGKEFTNTKKRRISSVGRATHS